MLWKKSVKLLSEKVINLVAKISNLELVDKYSVANHSRDICHTDYFALLM